jgi:hypothetical protein
MTKVINAKTPKGAASQLLRAIRKFDPDERNSGITSFAGAPKVYWTSGPYEWSVIATGTGDIFAEEQGGDLADAYQNPPTFYMKSKNWYAEPYETYSLIFWQA